MPDYGVTDTGFKRKRLDSILEELNDEMRSIFGDDIDLSPESPDGQEIGVRAESLANLWELAEEVFNAYNPSGASGATLKNLAQLNRIIPLEATRSTISDVALGGTPGTVIPAGSLVSTNNTNSQFSTDEGVVLDSGGTARVDVTAVSTGPITASVASLINIDTPISGWNLCFNNNAAVPGTDAETSAELRARRSRSTAASAGSILESIRANVLAVDGVTSARVYENDTGQTDSDGLPAHHSHIVVEGGSDANIAKAIYSKKPPGSPLFGNTSSDVTDSQGFIKTIRFSRPVEIPIYITVDISTDDDYPLDGDELIKSALVDYANGDLIEGRGFSVGDDVIYSRLYTPINTVKGHEIDSLRVGTTPSPSGTGNITIDLVEIAKFTALNITVNSQ